MPTARRSDPKKEELRRRGVLHPHPERVKDEAFRSHEFFDAHDLVQVRYEMIRRHRKDEVPIAKVARDFGVTRPTYYQTQAAYDIAGIAGLVPRKRGPKAARRCTPEIVEFARKLREDEPTRTTEDILGQIAARFGVTIHRRTLERGLAKEGATKRGRST